MVAIGKARRTMKVNQQEMRQALAIAASLQRTGSRLEPGYTALRGASSKLGPVLRVESWGAGGTWFESNILVAEDFKLDASLPTEALRLAIDCHSGELRIREKSGRLLLDSESRSTHSIAISSLEPSQPTVGDVVRTNQGTRQDLAQCLSLAHMASTEAHRSQWMQAITANGEIAVAANGYILGRMQTSQHWAIPAAFASVVQRAILPYQHVKIVQHIKHVSIENEHFKMIIPSAWEQPPATVYDLRIEPSNTLEIDTPSMEEALSVCVTGHKISQLTGGSAELRDPIVDLAWESGSLFVRSPDGYTEEELQDAVVTGDDLIIRLNTRLLLPVLGAVQESTVTLGARGPTDPIAVSSATLDAVVMPVSR